MQLKVNDCLLIIDALEEQVSYLDTLKRYYADNDSKLKELENKLVKYDKLIEIINKIKEMEVNE